MVPDIPKRDRSDEAPMSISSADAIAGKTLRERLADHWEALDNADRTIVNLGDEIATAQVQRQQAFAQINDLTAQLENLGSRLWSHARG